MRNAFSLIALTAVLAACSQAEEPASAPETAAEPAVTTQASPEALDQAGIEIPFPQTDLRIRSLFGREGDDALEVMTTGKAPRPKPAPRKQKKKAASSASENDAAEDLMQPSLAEAPEVEPELE